MSFTLSGWPIAVVCIVIAFFLSRRKREGPSLPPGPKRLPLIGNFFDAPKDYEWLTYEEWGRQFDSDILYYENFGVPIVVVNSLEAANDLFVKRSAIYSDRPPQPMMNDLIGFTWHFAFTSYGDYWKERRKLFHREFSSPVAFPHQPKTLHAARVFLRQLLEAPDQRNLHLRHMTASIMIGAGYGIQVKTEDDPYVDIAQKAMYALAAAGNSGSFLVDYLPLLKYVPDWLPGAGFKRKAKEWRKSVTVLANLPFEFAKESFANGTAVDSVGRRLLEELADSGSQGAEYTRRELVVRDSGIDVPSMLTPRSAGSDTTISAFETFFLSMVQHPDIQRKARACVDTIVNISKDGRLPDFSDREDNGTTSPPYLEAVLREVLRWQAVTPLAVPHRVIQEDVYRGYRIPAGSVVIGNAWSMLRDEKVYHDPHVFNPERWLKDGHLNPDLPDPIVAFGFGRRVCPGKDMATASLWITMVSVLACFDIEKPVDANGVEINAPIEYDTGLIRHPKPFKCVIKPRSKEAEALIMLESNA